MRIQNKTTAVLGTYHHTAIVIVAEPIELPRVRYGQRLQHHRINECENRRGGADAEGESEDGNGGEAGVLAERACAKANVLPEGFERGESPQLAAPLSGKRGVAQLAARGVTRFIGVDAFGAILFFPLGEMKGQLVFQVAVELAAMEERFEAEAKSVNPFCKHGG